MCSRAVGKPGLLDDENQYFITFATVCLNGSYACESGKVLNRQKFNNISIFVQICEI